MLSVVPRQMSDVLPCLAAFVPPDLDERVIPHIQCGIFRIVVGLWLAVMAWIEHRRMTLDSNIVQTPKAPSFGSSFEHTTGKKHKRITGTSSPDIRVGQERGMN